MDSGACVLIIHDLFVCMHKLNTRKISASRWSTMAGSFSMSCEAEVKITLPQLNVTARLFASFHITSQKSNYNVCYGQNLLREFKNKFRFPKQLCWLKKKQDINKTC